MGVPLWIGLDLVMAFYCYQCLVSRFPKSESWSRIFGDSGSGIRFKIFDHQKFSNTTVEQYFDKKHYFYPELLWRDFKLKEKPLANKIKHLALQNMKFFFFAGQFCFPGSRSGFPIRIWIHRPNWIRIQFMFEQANWQYEIGLRGRLVQCRASSE